MGRCQIPSIVAVGRQRIPNRRQAKQVDVARPLEGAEVGLRRCWRLLLSSDFSSASSSATISPRPVSRPRHHRRGGRGGGGRGRDGSGRGGRGGRGGGRGGGGSLLVGDASSASRINLRALEGAGYVHLFGLAPVLNALAADGDNRRDLTSPHDALVALEERRQLSSSQQLDIDDVAGRGDVDGDVDVDVDAVGDDGYDDIDMGQQQQQRQPQQRQEDGNDRGKSANRKLNSLPGSSYRREWVAVAVEVAVEVAVAAAAAMG